MATAAELHSIKQQQNLTGDEGSIFLSLMPGVMFLVHFAVLQLKRMENEQESARRLREVSPEFIGDMHSWENQPLEIQQTRSQYDQAPTSISERRSEVASQRMPGPLIPRSEMEG